MAQTRKYIIKAGTWISGVTYMQQDLLLDLLEKLPLRHFALCFHDKDTNEDGTPKVPHIHFLLNLQKDKTTQWCCNTFARYQAEQGVEEIQNTLCEVATDPTQVYRYLRHADDPNKVQYDIDEVITDDSAYWLIREEKRYSDYDDKNQALNIVTDIMSGVSQMEMLRRYGREYVINRDKYMAFVRGLDSDMQEV